MCGFVGFTNHIDNSNVVLGEMLDKIKHRGPDAEGTYIDEDIALGHRRLSIIDVSEAGTQPLYSEDGNLALLFNGEIYNYQEIRARLIEAGYHFATQTDSEVLIYGYQETLWSTGLFRHQAHVLCPDGRNVPVRLGDQELSVPPAF